MVLWRLILFQYSPLKFALIYDPVRNNNISPFEHSVGTGSAGDFGPIFHQGQIVLQLMRVWLGPITKAIRNLNLIIIIIIMSDMVLYKVKKETVKIKILMMDSEEP